MSSSIGSSYWLIMYCTVILATQQMLLCTAFDYGMPRSPRRNFAFKNFGLQTARGFGKRGGDALYQMDNLNDVRLDDDLQEDLLDSLTAPNTDKQMTNNFHSTSEYLPSWMYSSWGPTAEAMGRRTYPFQFFSPMVPNGRSSNLLPRPRIAKQEKA